VDWDTLLADCVRFTQRLIQTPSMTYHEAAVAELIMDEMRRLHFDEVWIDEIGNVSGRIYGQDRELGALVLNSHTDHVDPGDLRLWPVPPYSGEIKEGRILGRGACDIKGPLAVQVYSMAALLRQEQRPRRDIVFSGVVQEEVGGGGALYWIEHLDYPVALIVLGEPSDNNLSVGHRGGLWMRLKFEGRSVHASVPEAGENPNYALANFLTRLQKAKEELSSHPLLGDTTVAPTIIKVDTTSFNVTPAWVQVTLDFRSASESVNSLIAFVERLVGDWPHQISNPLEREPDTAFVASDEVVAGFYTPPESEVVQRSRALIAQGMGREPTLTSYRFATDGRFFTRFPIIGYSPGEEPLAHTVKESISIAKMAKSLRGHVQLLRDY
jgi:succinyl-diaminopimelate desuccinylase